MRSPHTPGADHSLTPSLPLIDSDPHQVPSSDRASSTALPGGLIRAHQHLPPGSGLCHFPTCLSGWTHPKPEPLSTTPASSAHTASASGPPCMRYVQARTPGPTHLSPPSTPTPNPQLQFLRCRQHPLLRAPQGLPAVVTSRCKVPPSGRAPSGRALPSSGLHSPVRFGGPGACLPQGLVYIRFCWRYPGPSLSVRPLEAFPDCPSTHDFSQRSSLPSTALVGAARVGASSVACGALLGTGPHQPGLCKPHTAEPLGTDG